MGANKVRVVKDNDNEWTVFNSQRSATIVKFNDSYGFIEKKPQYRVDAGMRTIATLIDSYQTARSIATKYVKGEAK